MSENKIIDAILAYLFKSDFGRSSHLYRAKPITNIAFCLLLILVGCSTRPANQIATQLARMAKAVQLPPEPVWVAPVGTNEAKAQVANGGAAQFGSLTFSNADIGPLFYHLEQSLSEGNWTLYASGPAMPGETKVLIEKTNAKAFFRVGWPMR